MGKGSRNRQLHQQDRIENPQKYKTKKQAPKWLFPLISLVVAVAIVVGIVASVVTNAGIIPRNRIIIKSESGEFDVNQNMATFIAWQSLYYNASMYWTYCSYGMIEDTYGITKSYTVDQYALTVAQSSLDTALRDSIDDVLESIKVYVAVCDAAYKAGVKLEDGDKTSVTEAIDELKGLQEEYNYTSLKSFIKTFMGTGMKEKDIRNALELISLYNKYSTAKQVEFEKAVTLADLKGYREQNPEDFYKIDYLTFAAENEEFAQKLTQEAKTPEDFKNMILEHHFAENYKTVYNKYTTQVKAAEDLEKINGKTNANGGTALTEALTEIGAVTKDYTSTEEGLNEDLKKWLFDTARKQYNTALVVSEDRVYVVAFMSEAANDSIVQASVKEFVFAEGDSHESDDAFKTNILAYLKESKKDEPNEENYPDVSYKSADDKASELKEKLKNDLDDVLDLLTEAGAKKVEGVTSSSAASKLPEVVRDKATATGVKAGDILVTDKDGTSYVIYVEKIEAKLYTLHYVTLEGDPYYQIINDLKTSLDKVYPTDKNIAYDADAKADSFEAWLSELSDKTALTAARKEGDTKYFKVEPTETEKKDGKTTTYNVYMVINTPMYLDTEKVVNGGYVLMDGEGFAAAANDALATLTGKTDAALLEALTAVKTSATTSASIKESTVTDANLKAWLFSEERTANQSAVINNTTGNGAYVAVFVEKQEAWYSAAKSGYVTEQMEKWVDSLTANYTANEKALNRIGDPTPETVTTAAATTAKAD